MNDRMKNTPQDHAVADRAHNSAGEEIRQFIERYEHLAAEKADITDQQREVMAEAKGRGFHVPTLKKLVAMRKKSSDDLAEEESLLELYRQSVGI